MAPTVDARTLSDGEIIDTDLCIVGAGTAGMTLAYQLRNQPFRICLVESGGLTPDPQTQDLHRGDNIGHPYFELHSARARHFGGTTNRWFIPCNGQAVGVRMRPLDPIDFEEREWVPYSGWPFRKETLDPYYDRAQRFCRIDPVSFQVADWSDAEHAALFDLRDTDAKTVIFKFGSRLPFVETYYPAVRRADNITILLHANVTEILTDEDGHRVRELRVNCFGGKQLFIRAKRFVLAAGALEIPRIMLLSNRQQTAGIGNQHDLVGRFFMEHPHFRTGIFVPSDARLFQTAALYNHIHMVGSVPVIGKLALKEPAIRRERLLNYVGELMPVMDLESSLYAFKIPRIDAQGVQAFRDLKTAVKRRKPPADLHRRLVQMLADIKPLSVSAYRNVKRRILSAVNKRRCMLFRLVNMSEQTPNPESRVTLTYQQDALGQKRIQLNWKLAPGDMQSAIRSQQLLDRALQRAGLGRLYTEKEDEIIPRRIKGGWHQMGTTRMHADPKKGVVDGNSRVHGFSNLYIAGSSVFPTGGYANPSLTLIALSLRLADHLNSKMVQRDN